MKNLKKIRTDVVGSLQRPPALKEARAKFDEGTLSGAEFRALEDQAVNEAVQMQETIGLDVLTDGEFRRLNFQDSFGMSVEGYDADTSKSTLKVYEKRVEGAAPNQRWDMPELQQAGTGVSTRRPTKARLRLTRNIPRKSTSTSARSPRYRPRCRSSGPTGSRNASTTRTQRTSIIRWTSLSTTWCGSSARSWKA
jgi:5-methyltetrahydropteroyltriglutamate--homocysteine methyltransferase